ncbi:hypothetical protein ALC56_09293 [Trachymyrmex septentrionalis]|uniref:Uncharacterized protein n=1 Tax=Trachymyrmex septentrionalis TaxID=34720 RepID=A0A195F7B5_9HYME|nr:hypothetical protein ALC56_09293 [Trachymyrmex septentrionalis]
MTSSDAALMNICTIIFQGGGGTTRRTIATRLLTTTLDIQEKLVTSKLRPSLAIAVDSAISEARRKSYCAICIQDKFLDDSAKSLMQKSSQYIQECEEESNFIILHLKKNKAARHIGCEGVREEEEDDEGEEEKHEESETREREKLEERKSHLVRHGPLVERIHQSLVSRASSQ